MVTANLASQCVPIAITNNEMDQMHVELESQSMAISSLRDVDNSATPIVKLLLETLDTRGNSHTIPDSKPWTAVADLDF